MLQQNVGVTDLTGSVDPRQLISIAAAINKQVSRDLPQYWPISATVVYLPDSSSIPQGCWPVFLVNELPPHEGGFHRTKNNQPYSKVIASSTNEDWSIDVSHEIIEMLVDPYGSRLQTAAAIEIVNGKIQDKSGKFEYLVEACDPCEANRYGYQIDGILVSDFLTPKFYDRVAAPDARYSFTGAITYPRQILPGGYISWVDPATREVQQLRYFSNNPVIVNLGPVTGQRSLREFSDSQTAALVAESPEATPEATTTARREHAELQQLAAEKRAKVYE